MAHCRTCGQRLHRVHRTLAERFLYMGVFECRQCKEVSRVARRYTYYMGPRARCPLCGTFRLRALMVRDHIDRMLHSPMSMLERIFGGRLYHCRYCRAQFYDRRPLAEESAVKSSLAG
jgi:hypothetical protein